MRIGAASGCYKSYPILTASTITNVRVEDDAPTDIVLCLKNQRSARVRFDRRAVGLRRASYFGARSLGL